MVGMTSDTIPHRAPYMDRINRGTWRRRGPLRQFGTASGWLEPGEQVAIGYVAPFVRDTPILDIGVGGGRTAPLLAALSADYRGIDYLGEMIALARRRFPAFSFLEMDARRLSFPDQSFRLVTFSYNGIDSVDLAGRMAILQETYRVLVPGGYFVFSALNLDGPSRGDHWLDLRAFNSAGLSPVRLLRAAAHFALGALNGLRLRSRTRTSHAVAIGNVSAHNFGLITLFTSVGEQLRQARECGFEVDAVIDPSGRRIALAGKPSDAAWHYFIVQKPTSAGERQVAAISRDGATARVVPSQSEARTNM
jgi:SAM-dependent methyltransferase